MSLDDFLKGIASFDKGLTEYAIGEAVTDANKQLRELNSQQMERAEMEAAQNELAQTFALRLGQAGASAAQVQQLSGQLGMTTPDQRRLDLQRKQVDQMALTQEAKNKRTTASAEIKQKTDIGKSVINLAKDFRDKSAKTYLDSVKSADASLNILEKFPLKRAVQELIKSGLIKSVEGGKVTDADVQRMRFDESLRADIVRRLGLEMGDNEVLAEPAQFYKSLFTAIRDKNIQDIRAEKARQLDVIKASDYIPVDQAESALNAVTGNYYTSAEQRVLNVNPSLKDNPEQLKKAVKQFNEYIMRQK